MTEGNDANSNFSSMRSYPKDIQLMANILKEMGVNDYEPRVLNHMLEFSYRYIITILEDADLYSKHARKSCIDSEDVKLAIELYQEKILTGPPSRDVIAEVANLRNSMPLPQIKASAGLRLPPDRHNLTACNYRLKPSFKKGKFQTVSKLGNTSLSTSTDFSASKMLSPVPPFSILPKSSSILTSTVTKPVASISKPIPTPIIKFSDGKSFSTATPMPSVPASIPSTIITSQPQVVMSDLCETSVAPQILMPTFGTSLATINQTPTMSTASSYIQMPTVSALNTEDKVSSENKSLNRSFEEDDDYDMQ